MYRRRIEGVQPLCVLYKPWICGWRPLIRSCASFSEGNSCVQSRWREQLKRPMAPKRERRAGDSMSVE